MNISSENPGRGEGGEGSGEGERERPERERDREKEGGRGGRGGREGGEGGEGGREGGREGEMEISTNLCQNLVEKGHIVLLCLDDVGEEDVGLVGNEVLKGHLPHTNDGVCL